MGKQKIFLNADQDSERNPDFCTYGNEYKIAVFRAHDNWSTEFAKFVLYFVLHFIIFYGNSLLNNENVFKKKMPTNPVFISIS